MRAPTSTTATGLGIVTPDDPLPTIEEAMRLYDVRWLALEGAHTVEALEPVIRGEVRPDWLSEPIVVDPAAATHRERSRPKRAIWSRPHARPSSRCASPPRMSGARHEAAPPARALLAGPRRAPAGRDRDPLPDYRTQRLLRGRGPEPRGRPRARQRRGLELCHGAAGSAQAGLRAVAADEHIRLGRGHGRARWLVLGRAGRRGGAGRVGRPAGVGHRSRGG